MASYNYYNFEDCTATRTSQCLKEKVKSSKQNVETGTTSDFQSQNRTESILTSTLHPEEMGEDDVELAF